MKETLRNFEKFFYHFNSEIWKKITNETSKLQQQKESSLPFEIDDTYRSRYHGWIEEILGYVEIYINEKKKKKEEKYLDTI